MFSNPQVTSPHLPVYPGRKSEEPGSNNQMEVKEDFGRVVRRIMYANSGNSVLDMKQSARENVMVVTNRDWSAYRELAEKAAHDGNYSQAEFMWLAALDEAKNFHPTDPRLLVSLDNLASLYCSLGRYDQAECFCRRAIEVAETSFGVEHPFLAHCLNNLAGVYYHQKRYEEAEPVCRRLLSIYESSSGEEHPDVGMAANNLAMLYHVQGKYHQAERLYLRALAVRAKTLNYGHPLMVTLLENYANLLSATGREEQAEQTRSLARGSGTHFKTITPG